MGQCRLPGRKHTVYVVAFFIFLSLCCSRRAFASSPGNIVDGTNVICGPKCVDYVLNNYQLPSPGIVALTRELQGEDVLLGSSISDLSNFLIKSGVQTQVVGLTTNARIDSPYPAIVHLNPSPSTDLGHFVVWLPSSTIETVHYWDDHTGMVSLPAASWLRMRSGAAILTSPEQLLPKRHAIARFAGVAGDSTYSRMISSIVFLLGACILVKAFSQTPTRGT